MKLADWKLIAAIAVAALAAGLAFIGNGGMFLVVFFGLVGFVIVFSLLAIVHFVWDRVAS